MALRWIDERVRRGGNLDMWGANAVQDVQHGPLAIKTITR